MSVNAIASVPAIERLRASMELKARPGSISPKGDTSQIRYFCEVKSGPNKGMSLPELFIKNPKAFLDEFYYQDRNTEIQCEAHDLIDDIGHICLPSRIKGFIRAVQITEPSKSFHLEIVSSKKRMQTLTESFIHRLCGSERTFNGESWCSDNVDLLAPYLRNINEAELKRAVKYLIEQIEGRKGVTWSRAECDRFFSNRANFLPYDERYYNGLDTREPLE